MKKYIIDEELVKALNLIIGKSCTFPFEQLAPIYNALNNLKMINEDQQKEPQNEQSKQKEEENE